LSEMGRTGWMGRRGGTGWMARAQGVFHPALPVLAGLLLLATAACNNAPPEDKDYAAKIQRSRSAKDAEFGANDDPIPKASHAKYLPLAYFPIDPDYNVPAALKRIDDPTVIEMPTSTGGADKFRRVGILEFVLKGQSLKLTAFVPAAARTIDRLFVPFSDLTSGTETYSAGRFLDLDRTGTDIYELDFNKAYIPYCYYNPTYECPIPPKDNRLNVPIRAGERMRKTA
ncbi:MAG TPA: DUF1684 domain-containing protein, partial [Vicinamibacterales bacterium]|nr:DUF1684 domain-containing protein [Vicinamibacterales bacterium]